MGSDDEYIDSPAFQKDTQLPQQFSDVPRTGIAQATQVQKKTRMERILRSETISTLAWTNRKSIKNTFKNIIADPLYKNSLFEMISIFVLGALGFVFWIIIARLYKAENVGIATTLISLMTLFSSFTIMGLSTTLNRYLPKSVDKNAFINSSFIIVTLVTIISAIIFFLGLQIFSPQLLFLRSNLFYSLSFTLFAIFCSWNILVDSIFMAFRSADNILIKNCIISILKLLLPFFLIVFGAYGIFVSTAAALAIGVLFSLIILVLKFKIRPSLAVDISLIRETSVYSFANYIASFVFNAPSLVLPVIILNVLSAKYAAYYYVASMIQNILLTIPLATAGALLTESSYNEIELKRHVRKALAIISVILLPATAIVFFASNILLQFFGKSYVIESSQFLQLYSVSTIFTAPFIIASTIMKVKHQIKLLVVTNILATILTLWLSYAFIGTKLVGIGWGWTLGQAIVGVFSLFFIIRNV
jgi:O-antigen/teichoic acid export membrane protein